MTALIPRMRNTWALFNMQRNEVHAMEACIVEGGDDWSWYHAGGREQDSADDETIQQADVIHSAGVAFRSIDKRFDVLNVEDWEIWRGHLLRE